MARVFHVIICTGQAQACDIHNSFFLSSDRFWPLDRATLPTVCNYHKVPFESPYPLVEEGHRLLNSNLWAMAQYSIFNDHSLVMSLCVFHFHPNPRTNWPSNYLVSSTLPLACSRRSVASIAWLRAVFQLQSSAASAALQDVVSPWLVFELSRRDCVAVSSFRAVRCKIISVIESLVKNKRDMHECILSRLHLPFFIRVVMSCS